MKSQNINQYCHNLLQKQNVSELTNGVTDQSKEILLGGKLFTFSLLFDVIRIGQVSIFTLDEFLVSPVSSINDGADKDQKQKSESTTGRDTHGGDRLVLDGVVF